MKAWLKAEVYDRWHLWASIWTMLLLTWAVIHCSSEGIVVALVSLAGTMFGVTGAVHGWKETTRTKAQGNGDLGFRPE